MQEPRAWYHLWIVPRYDTLLTEMQLPIGLPGFSPKWFSVGWHYMSKLELQVLQAMMACCSDAFHQLYLTTATGEFVASFECDAPPGW